MKTVKQHKAPATLLSVRPTCLREAKQPRYLEEQVPRRFSHLFFYFGAFSAPMIKCKMRYEMFVYSNPPVAMLLAIVKTGSNVAPINDVCLEDGRGSSSMGTRNQNQTSKQTGSVRGPNAGQQRRRRSLWRKPSNMGIFPLGPIWDVPDGPLLPCWRLRLSKCKNAASP